MYSSNNYIYETIDVVVRPAKTVYIQDADIKVIADRLNDIDNFTKVEFDEDGRPVNELLKSVFSKQDPGLMRALVWKGEDDKLGIYTIASEGVKPQTKRFAMYRPPGDNSLVGDNEPDATLPVCDPQGKFDPVNKKTLDSAIQAIYSSDINTTGKIKADGRVTGNDVYAKEYLQTPKIVHPSQGVIDITSIVKFSKRPQIGASDNACGALIYGLLQVDQIQALSSPLEVNTPVHIASSADDALEVEGTISAKGPIRTAYSPVKPNDVVNLDYFNKNKGSGGGGGTTVTVGGVAQNVWDADTKVNKPDSPGNCVIGYNNSVGSFKVNYTNTIPYNGRFCTPGGASDGVSEPGGDGYYVQKDPINPYHVANKKFVEDTVANAGSKLYLHDLSISGLTEDYSDFFRSNIKILSTSSAALTMDNFPVIGHDDSLIFLPGSGYHMDATSGTIDSGPLVKVQYDKEISFNFYDLLNSSNTVYLEFYKFNVSMIDNVIEL